MIVSYRGKRTAAFAARKRVKALAGVERPARLALDRLAAAHALEDLRALQSHRLEPCTREHCRPHAIRVNDEWRLCFEWLETASGPTNVELVESESGGHVAPSPIHPGEHLAEELRALNMSASEFARRIEVPVNRVTKILNGERGITPDTALRLARFFGTSAELWLNLQSLHDLRVAEAKAGADIQRLPTLKP
ncbi:MAG TPA: HigA family addiction module antitoxin [Vicinamibacterales bacterium]|nr:HigA family addiction module antitoxin [Vicinamibacterales bacterium]